MAFSKQERGNILFLILLAVILFAALSYAVTQSLRGGGKDSGGESDKMIASQMMGYMHSIEQVVTRLRLVNGCTDTEISFKNNVVTSYNAHVAPAKCEVFGDEGGKATFELVPQDLQRSSASYDYYRFTTQSGIANIGTTCNTAPCSEVYIWVRSIDKDVCMTFNDMNDVPNISGDAPISGGVYGTHFTGTHLYGNIFGLPASGLGNASFTGKWTGCYKDFSETDANGNPYYDFYYVLIAR